MSNHDGAKTPDVLTITKGDKTLRLIVGQPGTADLYAFRRWARTQLKAKAVPLAELGLAALSPKDRATLIDSYVKHCAAAQPEPTAADFIDLMQTPAGCAQIVWLCARAAQPGLKLADVEALIDETNADAVLAGLDPATGLAGEEELPAVSAEAPDDEDGDGDDDDEPGE